MWQVIKKLGVTKTSNFNVNHPFISEFNINIFSIPTETILQKIGQKWRRGNSRKQIFAGSIRGSCGGVRGNYAEGFAEVRPSSSNLRRNFRHHLTCCSMRMCHECRVFMPSMRRSNFHAYGAEQQTNLHSQWIVSHANLPPLHVHLPLSV